MLSKLTLEGVGPAKRLDVEFSERLNLITGDNGLGKSFLLDVAWWALTGTRPRLLPRAGARKAGVGASIQFRGHVLAGYSKAITLVQADSLQTRVLYSQPGRSLALRPLPSPDGRLVAVAFQDIPGKKDGVVIVDAQTGEVRLNMETTEYLQLNGWTPNSKHLVLYAAARNPSDTFDRSLAGAEAWRVPVNGGAIAKSSLPPLFRMGFPPIPQSNGNFFIQASGSFTQEIWAVDNCLPKN